MRCVLQRVKKGSVTIKGIEKREIDKGFVLLLGVDSRDSNEDIQWLCRKILNMRIFTDENDKMNLSLQDIEGEILIISQFTLFAKVKKGNRPSFDGSAPPEIAIPLYKEFIKTIKTNFPGKVATGEFGASMEVEIINDGPVTILLDSHNRE